MTPPVLMDRQLARLSGVDLDTIRFRRLGVEHGKRIDAALQTLEPLAERLCFNRPPFDLANDPDDDDGVILRHLKARHTEAKDITLTFDRPRQRFTPRTSTPIPATPGKLQSALAALGTSTRPATEESGGDE